MAESLIKSNQKEINKGLDICFFFFFFVLWRISTKVIQKLINISVSYMEDKNIIILKFYKYIL